MANKTCFDSEKYLKKQSELINERLKIFDNKLYLEFGGKLFDDMHASRVLPGFEPNIQIKILENFKDDCEIILTISAKDIEKNKIRADNQMTYDMEVLRLISKLRKNNLYVSAVVITLFNGEQSAINFKQKLTQIGERVYTHYYTPGYPTDINTVVSDKGYGKNEYIKTTKKIVAVTAPGPGSGKLATCLSQLYHEYKNGKRAGYAKFEKFPVYNLGLKDPINIAYEAATADLGDKNVIDFYHFDAYNKVAVSYNRDMETFPVIRKILGKIMGKEEYKSPTDMGINSIKDCIFDFELANYSAKQEIIRRYLKAKVDYKRNNANYICVERIKLLMDELNLSKYNRPCVEIAEKTFVNSKKPAMAIELDDGTIIVGKETFLLSAPASAIVNAIKHIADIEDSVDLLDLDVVSDIRKLKTSILNSDSETLTLKETLVALAISADKITTTQKAYSAMKNLRNCVAHSTHILRPNNEETLRKLGIDLTSGDLLNIDGFFDK